MFSLVVSPWFAASYRFIKEVSLKLCNFNSGLLGFFFFKIGYVSFMPVF